MKRVFPPLQMRFHFLVRHFLQPESRQQEFHRPGSHRRHRFPHFLPALHLLRFLRQRRMKQAFQPLQMRLHFPVQHFLQPGFHQPESRLRFQARRFLRSDHGFRHPHRQNRLQAPLIHQQAPPVLSFHLLHRPHQGFPHLHRLRLRFPLQEAHQVRSLRHHLSELQRLQALHLLQAAQRILLPRFHFHHLFQTEHLLPFLSQTDFQLRHFHFLSQAPALRNQ